jgi:hypothetical protein
MDFSMKGTVPFCAREWNTTTKPVVMMPSDIHSSLGREDLSIESVQRPIVAPFTV